MARKPRDLVRPMKEARRLLALSPLMAILREEPPEPAKTEVATNKAPEPAKPEVATNKAPEPAKPEVATNKAPEASTANSQQRFDRNLPKQLKDQNPGW